MFDHGIFLRAGHGEMLQAKPPRLHWARITYVSVAIYHYSVYQPRTWNNLRFHYSRWTWLRFIHPNGWLENYVLNKETSPTWSTHRILEPTSTYQYAPHTPPRKPTGKMMTFPSTVPLPRSWLNNSWYIQSWCVLQGDTWRSAATNGRVVKMITSWSKVHPTKIWMVFIGNMKVVDSRFFLEVPLRQLHR